MNLLKEFYLNDSCSYLQNKEQTMHYKIIHDCSASYCQELIERGYRRFGKMYFRPICQECMECQSIKIDVANFKFTKSKRRVLNKAKDLRVYIQSPSITKEHITLFEKYHLYMKEKKGWEYQQTSLQHYYNSFVDGDNGFGYEVLYFDEQRLIAVDLIDILDNGISSIYFYYDPEYSHLSLGKLSLYNQIRYARKYNKKWIYLGYYVAECPSLAYKAEYTPYLTLQGRPDLEKSYEWF